MTRPVPAQGSGRRSEGQEARPGADSPQRVDPLGATGARPLTAAAGASAFLLGLVATLLGVDELTRPGAALGAVALVAAAGLALWLAASPARAPFSTGAVVGVVLLGAAATAASTVATWGANVSVRDDWVPFALGVLVLGLAPYRPGADLLRAGGLLALVVALATLVQAPGFAAPVPRAVFVVVAVTPVLALAVGGAVFSSTFVALVRRWREQAQAQRRETTSALRGQVARSVQQDRVTVLNRDVVPFFANLLRRGVVTADDLAGARRAGDSLRTTLVAEADRTWLEALFASPLTSVAGEVDDPAGAAALLPRERRTVVRALLVALGDSDVVDGRAVRVAVAADGARVDVVVTAPVTAPEPLVRTRVEPWSAVLRVVFADARVDPAGAALTLRFSYDQH